jgi:hypothetical protein
MLEQQGDGLPGCLLAKIICQQCAWGLCQLLVLLVLLWLRERQSGVRARLLGVFLVACVHGRKQLQAVTGPQQLLCVRACFVAAPLLERPFADSFDSAKLYMCVLVLGVQMCLCRRQPCCRCCCCDVRLR